MRLGWLTAAGAGAALVFNGGWAIAGGISDTADVVTGRSPTSTADGASVWNAARTLSGLLVVALAVGLHRRLRGLRGATAATALPGLFGATLAGAFAFRRDCRTTEPDCGADGT